MTQLLTNAETRKALGADFKVSAGSISYSLHFKLNSIRARKIRSRCFNHYHAVYFDYKRCLTKNR